jgi:hypothetical protein
MKVIDFYKLPRNVQDNLLEGFRGEFDPRPILAHKGTRPTMHAWLGLAGLAAIALVALCVVGFGDIEAALAIHPTALVIVYVALAGTVAVGVAQAMAHRQSIRALPFAPGTYLFPVNLIDARDKNLRVFSLGELTGVSSAGGAVVARFGVRSYTFRVGAEHVEHAVTLVEAARAHASADLDEAERRKLDPLEPPVVNNPLASTVPIAMPAPNVLKLRWIIAAAVAVSIGGGLFYLRNARSDAQMFATAKARDDVSSYQRYLSRGLRHTDEVSRELLPRAELRLSVAEGSVDAIDAFIARYPDTGIQGEVEAAKKKALLAAFEEARAKGTLTALEEFAQSYPDHGLQGELSAARHAIYARALERYRAQMPESATDIAVFVERMLASAEETGTTQTEAGVRGPTAEVRVMRVPSRELKRSDDLVQKNPMYTGVKSLPSRYLDAAHMQAHEQSVARALAETLSRAFDPEVIVFAPGARVDAEELPAVTTPTIFVTYRVEPSGSAYASKKPMGIYVGLLFYFTLELALPGEKETLRSKHNFVQKIPLEIIRKVDTVPPPGTLETQIYESMSSDAFAAIARRFNVQWFGKETTE